MVPVLNEKIKQLAKEEKVTYIDIVPLFADEKGNLKREITMDGVHLKASAYITWVNYLKEQRYL
ncbi:hypothetical protein D3C80_2005350 [compost metagenome]